MEDYPKTFMESEKQFAIVVNGFLVLGSLLLTFLIAEIAIRLIYGNQPIFIYPQVIHIPTAYGYKLKPNQKGTYTLDKPIMTNSFGFRDYEWSVPKIPGRIRIMCIGDSLTFGAGVSVEDTYPKVLERKLRGLNQDVEVISTAVSGWATYNEVDFLKNEGIDYEPDIIIIGFYLNDFMSRPKVLISPPLTEEGGVDARPLWLRWLPYRYIFLLKKSALITFLRYRIDNIRKGERYFVTLLLRNEIDMNEDKGIKDTFSYILEIKEIRDKRDIKLILASIPSVNSFWFPKDSFDYIKYLRDLCESNNILFLDLAEDFWESGETNKLYMYPWDNHLNPAGHKLVADQLYRKLAHLVRP